MSLATSVQPLPLPQPFTASMMDLQCIGGKVHLAVLTSAIQVLLPHRLWSGHLSKWPPVEQPSTACPSRLMREKLLWTSLVYICVSGCHDLIAEMDQIASQQEPTVIFLGLLHVSLLACLAGVVCVVRGSGRVPAGRGCMSIAYLFHLQQELCALWLPGAGLEHLQLHSPDGGGACVHPSQSLLCLRPPTRVLPFAS